MMLPLVTIVVLLGQPVPPQAAPTQAAPPAPPPVNCVVQNDPAVMAYCEGQDALSQVSKDRAVAAFRRAADLSRDTALKKRALEQLERLYGPELLNLPHAADPILRELMALSHNDLAPMFRLAKLQERQEQFDAAESTLLAARQLKPDDAAPYRELAQYFARRASAMTAVKESEDRASNPEGTANADKDGIYEIGGPIEAPELLAPEDTAIPSDVTAGGRSGSVGLELVVDESGSVASAKVIRSVPGLDAIALAMVKLWRYKPAMLNGRPVPVRFPAVVRFGGGVI